MRFHLAFSHGETPIHLIEVNAVPEAPLRFRYRARLPPHHRAENFRSLILPSCLSLHRSSPEHAAHHPSTLTESPPPLRQRPPPADRRQVWRSSWRVFVCLDSRWLEVSKIDSLVDEIASIARSRAPASSGIIPLSPSPPPPPPPPLLLLLLLFLLLVLLLLLLLLLLAFLTNRVVHRL